MNIYRNLDKLPPFNNTVITIGSFDGVHMGHQKILHRVKKLANEISGESIVITFYPHPRDIVDAGDKKIPQLNTLEEKLRLIKDMGIQNVIVVPFSFEFSRQSPREYVEKFIIHNFNPAYIVIGYDHRFGLNRMGDIHLLREYQSMHSFKVIEISKQEIDDNAISSTQIRKSLLAGDIETATLYLNQPYILSGKVVHGDKLGSKLGYPTANLQISEPNKLLPKPGVFAVRIEIEETRFEGMMYIGKRPTAFNQEENNIEINIFDFNQNIYNKNVHIFILKHLREDIKFDSLEELKEQLKVDEINAQNAIENINKQKSQKPKITVAILNYNGVDLLESYLPLMAYSSSKFEFEILLIDNKSTDLSVDFVKEWYPEIKINELTKNYGYAQGYNVGLVDVDSQYTVIINSDVLVTENWLDPLIEKMNSDKTIGVVQPKIKSLEHRESFEYAGAAGGFLDMWCYPFCRGRIFDAIEKDDNQYDEPIEIFWASGAAMVVRTQLFKDIGGFDGSFFAHQEEIDFCWRIKNAGYSVWCEPKSEVYHLGGGTLDYINPRKDYLNFRNNLITITKNEKLANLLWLIPLKLILDGIAGIKFLFEGKPQSTWAVIRAHLRYYVMLPNIFERLNKEYTLIRKNKIGPANKKGRYGQSIIWKYYVEGKKKFSELNVK